MALFDKGRMSLTFLLSERKQCPSFSHVHKLKHSQLHPPEPLQPPPIGRASEEGRRIPALGLLGRLPQSAARSGPLPMFPSSSPVSAQSSTRSNMLSGDRSVKQNFVFSPAKHYVSTSSPPSSCSDDTQTKSYDRDAKSPAPTLRTSSIHSGRIDKKGQTRRKRMWTPEEDALLRRVAGDAPENWNLIGMYLPGRTGKQCRERWLNNLRPDIRKGGWSQEEDEIILREQALRGNQWSSIARLLVGRSDNAIKNRFASKLKKTALTLKSMPSEDGREGNDNESGRTIKYATVIPMDQGSVKHIRTPTAYGDWAPSNQC